MKITEARELEKFYNRTYGCNNCIRQGGQCFGHRRDCKLTLSIAEHISEPEKIDKFVMVLLKFNMKVVVVGNDFKIVAV